MDNGKNDRHEPWCVPCVYYARSTMSCDYYLKTDVRRPCPAGAGCTARVTRKELSKMRKPKWDTELGRLLWLDGQTDGQIADALGVQTSAVTAFRKRHWEKGGAKPLKEIGGVPENLLRKNAESSVPFTMPA